MARRPLQSQTRNGCREYVGMLTSQNREASLLNWRSDGRDAVLWVLFLISKLKLSHVVTTVLNKDK
jgi:hypothetical protein